LLKSYSDNQNFEYEYLTDEEIKKNYSTAKFKVNDAFLEFLHKYEYLWLDSKYSVNYIISPMKNYLIYRDFAEADERTKGVLFTNLTQLRYIDLGFRMANGSNLIDTLVGDTGSGKSSIARSTAVYIHNFVREVLNEESRFTVKNICFSRSEIIDLAKDLKPFETCIFDEDNEAMIGTGAFLQKSLINRFEKTLRSMQNNFLNCSPNLTSHNEHHILNCIGINDFLKSNKAIFRERGKTPRGFFLTAYEDTPFFNKLLSDYAVKKKVFQEDLKAQRGDENRFKRMCEFAVNIIKMHGLSYKDKNSFDFWIEKEYKLDTKSVKELKSLMILLLDSRSDLRELKVYKDSILSTNLESIKPL